VTAAAGAGSTPSSIAAHRAAVRNLVAPRVKPNPVPSKLRTGARFPLRPPDGGTIGVVPRYH